jgi:hypothetical protein
MRTLFRSFRLARALAWSRWLAPLVLAAAVGTTSSVLAQGLPPHRAGLVVVHGDGRVVTRCVTFTEESISGAEVLRRSGLAVVFTSYGGLGYGVCAIDGEGCEAGRDCFCQCRTTPCAYWIYSHRQSDGSWVVSGVGASSWSLSDGDVDGWVWGDGSVIPPDLGLEEICASSAESSPPSDLPSPPSEVQPIASATSSPLPVSTPTFPPGSISSPRAAAAPTSTPAVSPLARQTLPSQPAREDRGQPRPSDGYLAFGLMAVGLVGLLIYGLFRQK